MKYGVWVCMLWALVGVGCVPQGAVKKGSKSLTTKKPKGPACIKGRIISENGKGMAYVFVRTEPTTSPAVTDANGFFEFCHVRKSSGDDTASQKLPLQQRMYTVHVKKEGFKAKPQQIDFKGKTVSVSAIRLVSDDKPLGEVKDEGKDKVQKPVPSGVTGTFPKGS